MQPGTVWRYSAYGMRILSQLCLPELPPAGVTGCDLIIERGTVVLPPEANPKGNPWVYVAGDQAYLHWDWVGTFQVSEGKRIVIQAPDDADEDLLRLYTLSSPLNVLLHQRGLFVLHGSAVAVNGAAVAFLGHKGWGKSTIAAMMCARGHGLLSDDAVALDMGDVAVPRVVPGFPRLKLWPDSAVQIGEEPEALPRLHPQWEKRSRAVPERFQMDPVPLKRLYVLSEGAEIASEALSHREAFVELVRHSPALFRLGSAAESPLHLRQCATLAEGGYAYRLARPRVLAELANLVEYVEQDLGCTIHA